MESEFNNQMMSLSALKSKILTLADVYDFTQRECKYIIINRLFFPENERIYR